MTNVAHRADPVLAPFRAALSELYGKRLERVVLFGSRARGDARPGSDYDVAVFIKDLSSRWEEAGKLSEIETEILYDKGAVINAMPYASGSWRDPVSPLMRAIRVEGIDL